MNIRPATLKNPLEPCNYADLQSVIARGKAVYNTSKFYVVRIPERKNFSITMDLNWAKSQKCDIAYTN